MVWAGDIAMVVPSPTASSKPPRRTAYFWKVTSVAFLAICGLVLCIKAVSQTASSLDLISSLSIVATPSSAPSSSPSSPNLSVDQQQQRLVVEDDDPIEIARKRKQRRREAAKATEHCPELPRVEYGDEEKVGEHYPVPVNYTRDECTCNPVRNFVILSMQRSGTGWFETFLNSHPNISSHGEIFIKRPRRENASTIATTLDHVFNLDWVSSAAKNTCTGAVGLKWMLNQGAMEYNADVAEYFRAHHVSVVLLLRRNVLRRLISILANAYDRKMNLTGVHKSHTHSKEEAAQLATFRPKVNAKHLEGNLQRVQEMVDDALRAFNGTRKMLIYYEQVVSNRTLVLEDVQRFLGVPVRELSSKQVKIHTKPLADTIENIEEVSKKLRGTEFERFLTEDEY